MSELKNILDKLKSVVFIFDENSATAKLNLLRQCSPLRLSKTKDILNYHNNLLFILGYCENEELHALAQCEMLRLAETIKKLFPDKKELLERSGLAFTETQGAYSLSLIKWMLEHFPGQIASHSFDEGGVHPKEVMKHALPEMEFELATDEKLKTIKWIQKASGQKKKTELLKWLVKQMDSIKANDLVKDQLFESMSVFVNIKPKSKILSKSFGNFELNNIVYHDKGLLKKFDERELIDRKLPTPKKLSKTEKDLIIERSRIALALLNRETDPVTYCDADGLLVYDLEHGLSIALFSMLPERRLPLESYIGFMMFKNGYPMAYGGGWVFAKRSLLGINIFEAYRGGESAFVFCQLLRTYKQSFGADYFEVEPYQFGKDNPEGLQSGAFWFYYRFGFRPVDKELHELALQEAATIKNTKGFRSSIETLKRFTHSNIWVNFKDNKKPINPSSVSKYITEKITKDFKGDRSAAEKFCAQKLKNELGLKKGGVGFGKLSLFVGLCLDIGKATASEKTKLKEFIFEKGNSEYKYIAICNQLNFEKLLIDKLKP